MPRCESIAMRFCTILLTVWLACLFTASHVIYAAPAHTISTIGEEQPVALEPLRGIAQVAVGGSHTCVLTESGAVSCWGKNNGGQLGDGTFEAQSLPVPVTGLSSNVAALVAGEDHSCVLVSDGRGSHGVKCWGWNSQGQLGDGTTTARSTPINISGLTTGVLSLAAGRDHTCAVVDGGAVRCWGDNGSGQLGDGTTNSHNTPVAVTGLGDTVDAITAGDDFTCALLNDKSVQCWGWNGYGQLGDDTREERTTPVTVTGLANIRAVAAGYAHTCALTQNNGVQCWGWNQLGQLGNSSNIDQTTPRDVSGLTSGVTRLALGGTHTCVVNSSGGVQCWGDNSQGRLGDGTEDDRNAPVFVSGLNSDVTLVAAGWAHSCAVTTAGEVKCWGSNRYAQLGDGQAMRSLIPTVVEGLSGAAHTVSAGSEHSCALVEPQRTGTAGNDVNCWGWNGSRQLGDGTTDTQSAPVPVETIDGSALTLISGSFHNCVITDNGSTNGATCWGFNGSGRLGTGTAETQESPVAVTALTAPAVALTAGYHTCARLGDGSARCWGHNNNGQLGDGTTEERLSPVTPIGLANNVLAIDAGAYHTCAIVGNGSSASGGLHCWGLNRDGQLGDGTLTDSNTPVAVTGLSSGVIAVDAGINHTCALLADRTVQCWGRNSSSQLGDGTITRRTTPVAVSGLSSVQKVAVGGSHTCALLTTGAVHCWGWNGYGQVGDGSTTSRATPVLLSGIPDGTADLTTGDSHTCVVTTEGAVYCWGEDDYGQLGSARITESTVPITVMTEVSGVSCFELVRSHSGNGTTPVATPTNSVGCAAGSYQAGAAISLLATPENGWTVSRWSGTANNSSTANTNSLTMPAQNHTISVTYVETTLCYGLTLTHSGNGSAPTATPTKSADCAETFYQAGELITLIATPATGQQVDGWQGTNADNSTAPTNTLTMPAANHTVNVTYVPLPSGDGDRYETDDSCDVARMIATDNSAQEHTFHREADVDWVKFNTSAGTTYRVEVRMAIDSLADVNLELYGDCNAAPTEKEDPSFNPGIRLDFQAVTDGMIYLRLANFDATIFGANAAYTLTVRELTPENDNRALIIVAGRLRGVDSLQSNIDDVTTAVYRLFQKNGYTDDNIYYLATNTRLPGYDVAATKDALRLAIVDWAANQLATDGVLTLYLMDHGSPNTFYIDELSGQRVTPSELDGWLTTLEELVPGLKINLFIEACQSGSFIDAAGGSVSKPGRLVVTSTDAVNDAKASRDGAYFSDHFLTALHQGDTVAASFDRARKIAQSVFALQRAWLDADGDAIANEFEDAVIAAGRSFANTGTLASNQWSPHIFSVTPPATIVDFSGTIRADVRDDLKVSQVWAVVYPPNYQTPTTVQELQAETLPSINLLPTGETDLYAGVYPGFTLPGTYRIVIQAADNEGLVATPREIEVVVDDGGVIFLPLVVR